MLIEAKWLVQPKAALVWPLKPCLVPCDVAAVFPFAGSAASKLSTYSRHRHLQTGTTSHMGYSSQGLSSQTLKDSSKAYLRAAKLFMQHTHTALSRCPSTYFLLLQVPGMASLSIQHPYLTCFTGPLLAN